ncbi:DUF262 domain-containing protein [Paenibacillus polymyxa]|uniref:DUF262 domain-containing protein n=1 Tax=Paenibacillus polymyxa TaxID=1406 RepID=A0AAP4EBR8_PAEPO|nr:DUF262 domain-containing protein [Paenibacillus polymyxa]MDH2333872.1 DUF262 domain-containing protein [Paenibacillus polymyxa]
MFEIIPARSESNQSILDWYRRKEQIDFDPPYQRVSGLWDVNARQLFIDSIINGYDVPKFYVHKPWNLNDKYLYSIIDGKQRLQCIFDFIENKFPLSKDFTLDDVESGDISGKSYDYLAVNYPKIVDRLDRYTLDVVQIITNDEEKIRELFLRLNEGIALNNSEKRLAKEGYLNREIKLIVSRHSFFSMLRFKNSRFSYEELLTKLLLLEYSDVLSSLTKTNLDKFVETFKIQKEEIDKVILRTISGLKLMSVIFQGIEDLLTQKTTIPIYYLFIRDNWDENPEKLRKFIYSFEKIKMNNRKMSFERLNPILNEYDRLNQQGANSLNAIKERLSILKQYYNIYKRQGFVDELTLIDSHELEWE